MSAARMSDSSRHEPEPLILLRDFEQTVSLLRLKGIPSLEKAIERMGSIIACGNLCRAARINPVFWRKFRRHIFNGFYFDEELQEVVWTAVEKKLVHLNLNTDYMYQMFIEEGELIMEPELQFPPMDWDSFGDMVSEHNEWDSLPLFLNIENLDSENWEVLNEFYDWGVPNEIANGYNWRDIREEFDQKGMHELNDFIDVMNNDTENFYFTWDDQSYITERLEYSPEVVRRLRREWKKAEKINKNLSLANDRWMEREYRKEVYAIMMRHRLGRS